MKNIKEKVLVNLNPCIILVAEIIIGILLITHPFGFTNAIISIIGILLALFGIKNLISGFRRIEKDSRKYATQYGGALLLIIGLVGCFMSEWIVGLIVVMSVFYGIALLASSVLKIQWTLDMFRSKQKWFAPLISTILTIILGLVILINPFATSLAMWQFMGIGLLIEAVSDLVTVYYRTPK